MSEPETIEHWYYTRSWKTKLGAIRRFEALTHFDEQVALGYTRTAAAYSVSRKYNVSVSTVWAWRSLVCGVPHPQWIYWLCERRAK